MGYNDYNIMCLCSVMFFILEMFKIFFYVSDKIIFCYFGYVGWFLDMGYVKVYYNLVR